MEYLSFSYDAEQFDVADLSLSPSIPTLDERFSTWTNQPLTVSLQPGQLGTVGLIRGEQSTISYSPLSPDGENPSNTGRSASEAGLQNSPLEGDIFQFSGQSWEDLRRDEIRSRRILVREPMYSRMANF